MYSNSFEVRKIYKKSSNLAEYAYLGRDISTHTAQLANPVHSQFI